MRCEDVPDRDGSGSFEARKRGFRISLYIDSLFVGRRSIKRRKLTKRSLEESKGIKNT
jgi:hypothetical protein